MSLFDAYLIAKSESRLFEERAKRLPVPEGQPGLLHRLRAAIRRARR